MENRRARRGDGPRRMVESVRRCHARQARAGRALGQPESEGSRRPRAGSARRAAAGTRRPLPHARCRVRADAPEDFACLADAAGRHEHRTIYAVARASERRLRSRPVRSRVGQRGRGPCRRGTKRSAVPLGATRLAGRRGAELLQPARTRRRAGAVHADREAARGSAQTGSAPLHRGRHRRARRGACEGGTRHGAVRCAGRRALARGVRA